MHDALYDAIFKRRSVRSYSGPLTAEMMEKVEEFARSLTPLHPGIRTELRLLNGDDVRGPFKVAAPHFLVLYSEPGEGSAANAGFLLQQMDLFLSSNGIGSCWQGGPRPSEGHSADGKEFIISLALGMSDGEVHRRDVREFKRKVMGEITSLTGMNELLEPARLAPSAMNRQNWYFTGDRNGIRVHHARSVLIGRMNQVNAGIALCHIWLAALHSGKDARLVCEEEVSSPKGYSYAASVVWE